MPIKEQKTGSDIEEGCFFYPEGVRVIFYIKEKSFIVIKGVLHHSMDVKRYF